MAFFKKNKEKVSKKKNDDDFDDFGDFDMDFDGLDDMDDMMNRKPSKREMAMMTAKAAVKKTGKNVAKDIIAETIPGDFEYNVTELRDLVQESKSVLKDAIDDVKNTAGKVMPAWLKEKLGIMDQVKMKSASKEDLRAAEMAAEFQAIFGDHTGKPKVMTSKDVSDEGIVKGKGTEAALSSLQNKISVNMANEMSRLSSFMIGVGGAYFRKSLELQYKSYHLDLDMVELQSTYFKTFSMQLDSISKNTALPEHVKITNAERFEGYLKQAMLEKTYAKAITNNEALSTFKANFTRAVKNKASAFKDAVNMIVDLKENTEDNKSLRYEILADMVGGFLGDKASGKLGKLTSSISGKFKDNEKLQRLGIGLENFIRNTDSTVDIMRTRVKDRLSALEDNIEIDGTIKRKFWGGVDGLLKMFKGKGRNTALKGDALDSFGKAAMFDKLTHRTINEGIPKYLSAILKGITDGNQMFLQANSKKLGKDWLSKHGSPELSYNIFDRKLTTLDEYKISASNAFGATFNKNNEYEKVAKDVANEAMSKLKSADSITSKEVGFMSSKETRDALSDYVKIAATDSSIAADYDTLFKDVLDPDKANPKLRELIKSNHKLERAIKLINKASEKEDKTRASIKDQFNAGLSNADSAYPFIPIQKLWKTVLGLGGGQTYNLTEEEAKIISKSLLSYLLNSADKQGPLGIEKKNWENAFKAPHLSVNDFRKISNALGYFFIAFDNILASGTPLVNSKFEAAIVSCINELKAKILIGDGVDEVLERTQFARDLNPEFVDRSNNMTINQVVNHSLDSIKEEDGVTDEELYKITRPSDKTVRAIHDNIFSTPFSKLADGTSKVAEDLKKIRTEHGTGLRGLTKQAEYFINQGKEKTENAIKGFRENSNKYAELAKDLSGKILSFTEEQIIASVKKIGSYGDDMIAKLEKMKEDEIETYNNDIKNLEDLKTVTKRVTDNEVDTVNNKITNVKNRHQKRMDMIDKVIKSIQDLNTSVKTRVDSATEGSKIETFMTNVKNKLNESITSLDNLISIAEKADV